MKFGNLNFSDGNSKIGKIWNFNLQAGKTCPMKCPGCYALKGRHVFSTVQKPRAENTDYIMKMEEEGKMNQVYKELDAFFTAKKPAYFRIHESGDFYSVAYAKVWYKVIKNHPETKFCVYTKAYDVVNKVRFYKLPNLELWLSSWIGLRIPEKLHKYYKVAWFKDNAGLETRVPSSAFCCPGKTKQCEHCLFCWNKISTKEVYFHEH